MIIAIDPGKEKCGLAVVDLEGVVRSQAIVSRQEICSMIPVLIAKYGVSALIVGRSSFGKDLEKDLSKLELQASLIFVSEAYSTQQARRRYWQENKPRGWWKLIPTTLRTPKEPVDDFAAVILAERYLKG